MQGHFDVGAYHTPGLTDEKLLAALGPVAQRKPGAVLDFLSQFDKRQEAKGHNQTFDTLAGMTFNALMGGAGINNPYQRDTSGTAFGLLYLATIDSEPTYTEQDGDAFLPFHSQPSTAGGSASKRFYEDQIEPYLISEDANGKEAFTFRSRFLWLPAQAISSTIRSIVVAFRQDNTTGSTYSGRVCRIRLKDSGGNPIVINKTGSITLFVEYRFTLASV
jgi:hypothetical protein